MEASATQASVSSDYSEGENDSDYYNTDDEDQPGPPKRLKVDRFKRKRGAAKYKTKFQLRWRQKWPFAVAVRDSPFSFRCSVCNKAISCAHQGERDVSCHADTASHKRNLEVLKQNQRLSFRSTADSQFAQEKVS